MRNEHRHQLIGVAPVVMLLVLVTSCGSPASISPRSTAGATGDAASTAPPSPTTAMISQELQGKWEAVISTGEQVTLTLGTGSYQVRRGPATGAGSVVVDGNVITFRSTRCELGAGSYEWTIEGDELVFVPMEPRDPCGQRIIFLEDALYTRAE